MASAVATVCPAHCLLRSPYAHSSARLRYMNTFVTCGRLGGSCDSCCIHRNSTHFPPAGYRQGSRAAVQPEPFWRICQRHNTDKCSRTRYDDHQYQYAYEKYLGNIRNNQVKMLEIGLGCDMKIGPGHSVALWMEYMPRAELWEAEVDVECARRINGSLGKRVSILTGSQEDVLTLRSWEQQSGGAFDFIIDDGAHETKAQLTSLDYLFHNVLKPGGFYFLEDIHYQTDHGGKHSRMLEILREWLLDLTASRRNRADAPMLGLPPRPAKLLSIDCFRDLCVLTKQPSDAGG